MPLGAAVAVDFTVGKFLPKCNLPMCKSMEGDEEAPHGAVDLANAFTVVKSTASSYDGWRRKGRTHKLEEIEQDDSRYRILMEGVEEERASVPVILFAMVEQVICKTTEAIEAFFQEDTTQPGPYSWHVLSAVGNTICFQVRRDANETSEAKENHEMNGAQADAELQAEATMDDLFSRVTETVGHLDVKKSSRANDPEHTILYHGDEIGYRACCLGSGFAQHRDASELFRNLDKTDEVCEDDENGEPSCLSGFTMDVTKVEEHMLKLYPTPGFRRRGIPQERVMGEEEVDMQRSEIMGLATSDALEDIERFRVLSSLAQLSPSGIAHRESIMERKHFEQMLPSVLIQTLMKAQAEFPKHATAYCPWNDSALVSYFCDDNEDALACTLPCISSFSRYWSEFKRSRGETPPHPDQKYSLDASATAKIWSRKYLYPSDGSFAHYSHSNVTISKGAGCMSFKGGNDACLVATFDNNTAMGIREIKREDEEVEDKTTPTLEFTMSTPEGTCVAMSTDGMVRIQRSSAGNAHCSTAVTKQSGVQVLGAPIEPANISTQCSEDVEAVRCILSNGAIIKKLGNGRRKVVFSDGGMMEQQKEGRRGWIFTSAEGERWFRPDRPVVAEEAPKEPAEELETSQEETDQNVPEGEGTDPKHPESTKVEENYDDVPLEKLLGASVVDPDTQAIVTTREDLLLIVSYPSGEKLIEHPDGTRVTTIGDAWNVESHGLPPVHGNSSTMSVTASPGCSMCWDSSTLSISTQRIDGSVFVGCDGVVASPGNVLVGDADCGSMVASAIQEIGSEYRTKVDEVENLRKEAQRRKEEREAEAARAREAEADIAEPAADTSETEANQGRQNTPAEEEAPIPDPFDGKTLGQLLACCDKLSGFVYDIHSGEAALLDRSARIAFHITGNGPVVEDLPEEVPVETVPEPQPRGIIQRGKSLLFGDPIDITEPEKASEITDAVTSERPGEDGKEEVQNTGDQVSRDEEEHSATLGAARVAPRLFVIFPSGDGYEAIDPGVFHTYCNSVDRAVVTVDSCAIAVSSQTRYGFPIPLMSHGHTFVAKYPQVDRRVPPLPLSENTTPWREDMTDKDAFKSLDRPSLIRSQAEGELRTLTFPRATGHKIKETSNSKLSKPVVVFREVTEFPQWQEGALQRIQDLLATFEQKTQDVCEDFEKFGLPYHRRILHAQDTDSRSERETHNATTLAARIRQMPQHRLESGRKIAEDLKSHDRAKQEALEQAEAAAAEERRLDAERRNKPKTPWPPKVGEFDHTPKRPVAGDVLIYAKSEEGLIAYSTDSGLANPSPFPADQLTKRVISPSSAGRVGASGVYISNSKAEMYTESKGRPKTENRGAKHNTHFVEPVESPSSPYQNINFDYPQYGYEVLGSQHHQPNMKSVAYSVDCQPRRFLPPMPATYTREEAKVLINRRYLGMEGDVLRVSQTASGKLVRSKGGGLRQFQLSPAHIHFGSVEVGRTAKRTALLTNVSLEKARFHVVTPALPFKVVYTPRLLAGGMATKLRVHLVAEQVGDFVGEIEVRSELNVLVLTCSAKVFGVEAPDNDLAQPSRSDGSRSEGSREDIPQSNTVPSS
ncbi:hypothetical protein BSKO_01856 [Bryopsis sp. KO-2023]|nr:hypothetical protein BSKO_01856 [Bryopsis sp. KO-2023]